jgi:hypothetical protein
MCCGQKRNSLKASQTPDSTVVTLLYCGGRALNPIQRGGHWEPVPVLAATSYANG